MMSHWGAGNRNIRKDMQNILAVLSEYSVHGRYKGLNEILVLKLLW